MFLDMSSCQFLKKNFKSYIYFTHKKVQFRIIQIACRIKLNILQYKWQAITVSSKASELWNIQTSTTWCQNLCSIWMPWHYQCSFPLIIFLAFSISWSKTLDCPRYLGRICSIADTLVDHLNPRWAKYSQWCVEVQDFGIYSYFPLWRRFFFINLGSWLIR